MLETVDSILSLLHFSRNGIMNKAAAAGGFCLIINIQPLCLHTVGSLNSNKSVMFVGIPTSSGCQNSLAS